MWPMLLTRWFARSSFASHKQTARRRPAPVRARPCVQVLDDRVLPSAYRVTTTDDSGPGSLRDAITQINADVNPDGSSKLSYTSSDPSRDEIDFGINSGSGYNPGTGVATITPGSDLPWISNTVIINGYTQGQSTSFPASPNTLTVGDNAVINVVLDGTLPELAVGGTVGLGLDGGSSTVEGLTIQNFHEDIALGSNNNLVAGNNLQVPNVAINGSPKVVLVGGSDNTIGRTSPGARNVIGISTFYGSGVEIQFGDQDNLVEGNYIGIDATGSVAVTPQSFGFGGVRVNGSDNTIGGTSAGAGNVISGWTADVVLANGPGNLVEGNYIGTNATGSGVLAGAPRTTSSAVWIVASGNTIGGTAPGAGNLIAGALTGVSVGDLIYAGSGGHIEPFLDTATGNSILGNSIYGNGGLGIDNLPNDPNFGTSNIGTPFVDTNWPGGPFTGTNNATFANLTLTQTGTQTGSTLTYTGTLSNGLPNTRYLAILGLLDSYGSYFGSYYTYFTTDANGQINGIQGAEGGTLTTDQNGQVTFTISFQAPSDFPPDPQGSAPFTLAPYATANPAHSFGNYEQDCPALSSATSSGSGVTISGTFNSTAGDTFRLEFFSNPQADPSGYGQGQMYLGSAQVTTDANGNPAFSPDGSAGINADGSFTVTLPTPVLVGQGILTATATDETTGDTSEFSPDLALPTGNVGPVTSQNLQALLNNVGLAGGSKAIAFEAADSNQAGAVLAAVNGLAPQPSPVTVALDLAPGTYGDMSASPPAGVTLVITGNGTTTTIVGHSPALAVGSGKVIVTGVALSTATDAPTILVSGGSLTLRNDTIEESTGFNDPAISITGGTVDLGTTASPGGNTINVHSGGAVIQNSTSTSFSAVGDSFTVNGGPLTPSCSLSGVVWQDFNDDGQVDFGETGISGVTITLTGKDFLGNSVSQSQQTDSNGVYVFLNLLPGSYTLTETPPSGYLPGIDSVGTAGGNVVASGQFSVPLGAELNGLNYNFGEQPLPGGAVQKGQSAGIGFWNNKKGQALILGLNGGSGHQLGDWLAATLPNIFGASAGSSDLAGQSNAAVAALFQQDFLQKGVKLDAQLLATALNVYVTNATLDSTNLATSYGFTVSGDGLGTATVNVGSSGDAFGVANNSVLTVMDLLLGANAQAVNGVLYNGNTTKSNEANAVFGAVNQAGGAG
jgi:hypothetical protein